MTRTQVHGWLRRLTAVADPRVRVVCFPHSGGSASSFREWVNATPPSVELIAVQYPGRGDRFGEPYVTDVTAMAEHTATEMAGLPAADNVLFGHSLGAVVAYEAALALRDMGDEPRKLCVSACYPPGRPADHDIQGYPDDEFWSALRRLGGTADGIAENAELRELMIPTIRADLGAHATYRPRADSGLLSCPVTCYHGEGDPLVDESWLPEWAAVTSGDFAVHARPGGHFHATADVATLVANVVGRAA